SPHEGVIIGCSWVPGRWPGKNGLEFKRVSDRVRFHLPGEFSSLTLMAWVRFDALPHRLNSLMMTHPRAAGGPHWHLSARGRVRRCVEGGGEKGNANYLPHRVFQPFRFGQWTHLAVVYDGDGETVTHYVNGQPVALEATRFDAPLCIRDAELGNWNVGNRKNE